MPPTHSRVRRRTIVRMSVSVSSPRAVAWRRTLGREARRGMVLAAVAALALAGVAVVAPDGAASRGWWAAVVPWIGVAAGVAVHTYGRVAIARRALRDGAAPDPQLLSAGVDPDAAPPNAAVVRRSLAARARSETPVVVFLLLLVLGYGWLMVAWRDLPTASIPAVAAGFVFALASIDAARSSALWLAATVLERRSRAVLETAGHGDLRVLRRVG